jgi:RNA polymerase sigma factor (TIGR02999 family)
LERSPLRIIIGCDLPWLGSQAVGGAMKDEVTSILSAVEQGDLRAAERLLPLIYDELRALAARKLAHEKPGQTLQATALVHEAYIRLVDTEKAQHWNSRGHFFAAAAEAMRRILIEKARQKSTRRRGQGRARSELRDDDLVASPLEDELLDLDEALTKLTAIDADAAAVAKLRLFAGMSVEEIAKIQQLSPRTVKRTWARARAWLGRALAESNP